MTPSEPVRFVEDDAERERGTARRRALVTALLREAEANASAADNAVLQGNAAAVSRARAEVQRLRGAAEDYEAEAVRCAT